MVLMNDFKAIQFQSTLPRGSDPHIAHHTNAANISIHAPSRERRALLAGAGTVAQISIHVPSRERPWKQLYLILMLYFNPRSLTGATCCFCSRYCYTITFQSTLPRGSDASATVYGIQLLLFQSTLPYGSDQLALFGFSSLTHFNPRSLAGATVLNKEIYAQGNISIHAPSRERRCSFH